MHLIRSLLIAVVAFVPLAGCSDSLVSPTPASSTPASTAFETAVLTELASVWTLSSIQPAGQTEQATPADTRYSLTIADGQLSTRADCNTCGGRFTLSGHTLTVGPALACTRAACRTMEFEGAYTRILAGESTVSVSGDTLVLSSSRGVLRFTRSS